ncbi:MAG: hypothetical protein KDE56_01955 [Anaerolineales bacterium]|nr:hypothetical protein [Anaerolineales bacterium]
MSTLEIAVLGTPTFLLDGQDLKLKPQQKTLLTYIVTRQHQANRAEATNLFWPQRDDRRKDNFRFLLGNLRSNVGSEWFVEKGLPLVWEKEGLWIDWVEFTTVLEERSLNIAEVTRVEKAVRLYRGRIDAEPSLRGKKKAGKLNETRKEFKFLKQETETGPLEEWLEDVNQIAERCLQKGLIWLTAYYQRLNQFDQAIEYAQQWLALDDLHEPAYRELMTLYATTGRTAEAMRLCKQLHQKLHDELGVEPDPETQALCEKLRRPQQEPDEAPDDQPPTPPPPSPYKGLAAFTENDTDLFYGRQRFIAELQQAVAHQPLVALTGASGSGKSSLLQAGLLSRLRHQPNWLLAPIVRPEATPLDNVVEALLRLLEPDQPYDLRREARLRLVDKITAGQLTLVELGLDILRQHPPQTRLLLTVDPFEELYTQSDKQSRRLFITQLLDLVDYRRPTTTSSPFAVVIALRADFLGEVYADERLTAALRQHTLVLGPMNAVEIQEAIEQPATQRGVLFEPGLVQRLLDDVADEPGQLPLLQFTLTELWQRQTGRRLRHAAYDGLGGVERALSHYATTVYEGLEAEEKPFARHIFVQLVAFEANSQPTRRRVRLTDLLRAEDDPAKVASVVELWVRERLLVVTDKDEGEIVVEIAHEALIHAWPKLQKWLEKNWNKELLLRPLTEAAKVWAVNNRDDSYLYRGKKLKETFSLLNAYSGLKLTSLQEEFLNASLWFLEPEQTIRVSALLALFGAGISHSLVIFFLLYMLETPFFSFALLGGALGSSIGPIYILGFDWVRHFSQPLPLWLKWSLPVTGTVVTFCISVSIIIGMSMVLPWYYVVALGSMWGLAAGVGRLWVLESKKHEWRKILITSIGCGIVLFVSSLLIPMNIEGVEEFKRTSFLIGSIIPLSTLSIVNLPQMMLRASVARRQVKDMR